MRQIKQYKEFYNIETLNEFLFTIDSESVVRISSFSISGNIVFSVIYKLIIITEISNNKVV
jgi:hypothetical protein